MTHFSRMLSRRHAHRGEIRLRLIRGLSNYRRSAADVAAAAAAPAQPKPHVIVFCEARAPRHLRSDASR